MKAVVMAGGEGTRLRPLTCSRPKPMVPVAGRPVMEHILLLLREHDLREVIATLQYQPNAITSFFGDGADLGIRLTYSVEQEPLGTAGSVRQVAADLTEPFLVISGDALTDIDLRALIRFHKEKGALVTMALARVESPLEYGVVITDAAGRIQRFLEKPGWGEVFSDTVNTGIYVIDPTVLALMAPNRPYDWSKEIFPRLLAEGAPLYGWVMDGYWCDIGNLDQYVTANQDALTGKVRLSIPGEEVAPGLWVGPGATIDPSVKRTGPVVIGANAVIKRHVAFGDWAVVGDGCHLDAGASFKRSIVLPHSYVGRGCEVRGAVIGQSSALQAGNRLFEGAVIGDNCHLLEGCQVQPGVKVWPSKRLEAGTRLTTSLVWGARHSPRLFGKSGIAGSTNLEITPELAVRLGAAFGSMLPKGASVAVARTDLAAARMMVQALESGLTAAGVHVADLGAMPLPTARYGARALGAAGGIYVGAEGGLVRLRFLDGRAIDLSPAEERKLENLLFREDTRRVAPAEVGAITFPGHLHDDYRQALLAQANAALIRQREYRIVADFRTTAVGPLLASLLPALGCRVLARGGPFGEQIEAPDGVAGMGDLVRQAGADLGVSWDPTGERLQLCDDRGQPLTGQQALALLAFLTLAMEPGAAIAVPITATHAIDQMAEATGGRIVRTRVAAGALMEAGVGSAVAMASDHGGAFAFPSFHPGPDGCFALIRLLELLAQCGSSISDLIEALPPVQVQRTTVPCPFATKGKVMRHLIESFADRPVQLVDGIKLYDGEGWIAILPDPVEPIFHLYAEPDGALLTAYGEMLAETVGAEAARPSREEVRHP